MRGVIRGGAIIAFSMHVCRDSAGEEGSGGSRDIGPPDLALALALLHYCTVLIPSRIFFLILYCPSPYYILHGTCPSGLGSPSAASEMTLHVTIPRTGP